MTGKTPQAPRSLDPSELGTKEYWDKTYTREITNHAGDENDEGTIWFEENNAERTVIKLLEELAEGELLVKTGSDASRILDLGTGNGHMLWALREDDDFDDVWTGEMVGVDYSETSVKLANQIGQQHESKEEHGSIQFEVWDILQDRPGSWLKDGFDLVLDKGTFDAISLMSQQETSSCEVYFKQVMPLIKDGGFLVITSCNWTKEELLSWVARSEVSWSLSFTQQGKYPTFSFGGQTGSSIVTLAFRKG